MAILAGDGLAGRSVRLLAREPQGYHPTLMTRKLRVLALVAEAAGAAGMVGGQAIDLDAVSPAPGPAAGDAARRRRPAATCTRARPAR